LEGVEEDYLGVTIDYSRDALLTEKAKVMLTRKGFYKKYWEESPQQTYARASTSYCFGDYEFAQRIYDYVSKGWFTFASPVLSNGVEVSWPTFGVDEFEEAGVWLEENVVADGMPISCFLSHVGDKRSSLVEARAETAWLSMMGGGIGIGLNNRSPDEKSTGVMAHLRGYDADALSYKQTASRRGSIAAYLDIDHPEIKSFISMRNPVGGDQNKKCFNLNNAVNVPDSFMEAMLAGEDYELVDPKHGPTGQHLSARAVWEEILVSRYETGEPYIHFIDTTNRNIPKWITRPTYHVRQSNLCSEITLMTSNKRTAVCCLSSVNLDKRDEWKDSDMVSDLVRLLDNVLEYFIRLAPKELHRATNSAVKERAIGLGTLGLHSYLQRHSIPFESGGIGSAAQTMGIIYKDLQEKAIEGSKILAEERGEPRDCMGSGMRNSHLIALAPNASSSDFVGVSPSSETWSANAFTSQGRAGSYLVKNPHLVTLLESYGKDNDEVWGAILEDNGSAQGLDFLTDLEREVFKTSTEINPMWVIELAAIRQKYICQSQSLNLFVTPSITMQEMSDVHIAAWKKGVKTLYYCRNEAPSKASVGTGGTKPLNSVPVVEKYSECLSCEG
jgi:ribonucleoside-diphosphate reductase alpha chain